MNGYEKRLVDAYNDSLIAKQKKDDEIDDALEQTIGAIADSLSPIVEDDDKLNKAIDAAIAAICDVLWNGQHKDLIMGEQ